MQTHLYSFNVVYRKKRYKKIWTVNFSDMLVNCGIRTLLFLWWAITVQPVLKWACIERPPVYKDHLKILLIREFIPTKCIHMFLWLVLPQKRCDIPSQKHLWCKNRWGQVSEWLKSMKSLWGQEEKIYQQGCVELQQVK